MSSTGLFETLQRNMRRGWGASRRFYRTLPRIEEWQWPFWSEKPKPVPVHVLTGEADWRMAAWMLASWFYFSEYAWPVVIHDDGTLPNSAGTALRKMFPECRIISRKEADEAVEKVLKPFPFCSEFRTMHPLALKIFDTAHFTSGTKYLIFDSDLLFFNFPGEIVDWAKGSEEDCWFNEDLREESVLSGAEALDELGVKLWERVNTGLCLLHRPAIDFDFCDRALAQTSLMRGKAEKIEKTLHALCASRNKKGGLLPGTYEISMARHASRQAVARHYVKAVRDRFFGEGLQRLENVLLAGV